jgi:hypothetical protein
MSRFDAPFPKDCTDKMFGEWSSFIGRRECASLLSLPRFDRQYRIPQFIQWHQLHNQTNIQCLSLSFQAQVTEVWPDMKQKLDGMKGKSSYTTFLVSDPEWLIYSAPHIIPELERYVLEPYRCVSFLFFFENNIFDHNYFSLFKDHPFFFQNIWHQRLYGKEDIIHFFKHLKTLYKTSVPETVYEEIWNACNGYLWLSTEAFRYASEHKKCAFDNDALQFRLRAIWDEFNHDEQIALKNIVCKLPVTVDSMETLKYFQKTGLLTEKMELTVPLLSTFIHSLISEDTTLSEDQQGHIYIGSVCIDASLSPLERKLMHFFFTHKREVVSREMTAAAVWGEAGEDSYSDWNLDQSINRLRKRLHASGLIDEVIQTRKGKGYYVGL